MVETFGRSAPSLDLQSVSTLFNFGSFILSRALELSIVPSTVHYAEEVGDISKGNL